MGKCPCGDRTTPDPSCDMCDGWRSDPDTGWGGYTNNFTGKHYYNEEDEQKEKSLFDLDDDGDLDDEQQN